MCDAFERVYARGLSALTQRLDALHLGVAEAEKHRTAEDEDEAHSATVHSVRSEWLKLPIFDESPIPIILGAPGKMRTHEVAFCDRQRTWCGWVDIRFG